MFYVYVILCVMKYVIKYVMNMYVCMQAWAYDPYD